MTQLSSEARTVLSDGLRADGPSRERQARVKAQLFAAIGSGALALGGAASAAGAAAPGLASGSLGVMKGLGLGALLLWFSAGAALGVGASGAVAIATRRAPEAAPVMERVGSARVKAPVVPVLPQRAPFGAPAPQNEAAPSLAAAPEPNRPSGVEPRVTGPAVSASVTEPLASAVAPLGSSSTLREEATLLERAQRALAANSPGLALAILDEHARRFPSGALREEREAASVLALCGLGRVSEARSLARAFVTAAPHSVLVPRLDRSCAAPW